MSRAVPAYRVTLNPTSAMVSEIITDTDQTMLAVSQPEMEYQAAYAAITSATRSKNTYVTEQSGLNQRHLLIRENGAISIIDALPERPSDSIAPPPEIPAALDPSGGRSPKRGGRSQSPAAQKIRVKVKVPQALLYGVSTGAFLIGSALGVVVGLWL